MLLMMIKYKVYTCFFCNICRPYKKNVCIGGVIMGGFHSIITAIGFES